MGMRDWLIIIVIVGIVLILADGYRRKHKNSIRLKIDKNIPPADAFDDDPLEIAELPNGGARIKDRRALAGQAESDYAEGAASYEEDEPFEEDVPVLMDAIELSSKLKNPGPQEQGPYSAAASSQEDEDEVFWDDIDEAEEVSDDADTQYAGHETFDDDKESEDLDDLEHEEEPAPVEALIKADELSAAQTEEGDSIDSDETDEDDEDSVLSSVRVSRREPVIRDRSSGRIEPSLGDLEPLSTDELDDKPQHLRQTDKKSKKSQEKEKNKAKNKTKNKAESADKDSLQTELFSESPEDHFQDEAEDDEQYLEPEEVIVINIMAKPGEYFAGKELLPILLQQGMQLGKMSIFHKHADTEGNGPVMYSMANMVKPGTFDVSQMDEFTTPGVSFFLQLPNQLGNMRCFEQMLNAANSIKNSLNGELKDENRSVITRQTIEHCRQRIQDFELAQLSRK